MATTRPILALPWHLLADQQFEELCYHLLIEMGFTDVEWFRGPGDRGRDLLARGSGTGLVDFGKTLSCVVECKRFGRHHTVGIEDLTRTVAWMDARPEYERLIVITTSRLRPDTRDWVYGLNTRPIAHYRIVYIESHELFQYLIRYQDVRQRFFPETDLSSSPMESSYNAFVRDLTAIWRARGTREDERIKHSATAFRYLDRALGGVDDLLSGVMFRAQRHRVRYSIRGVSDIQIRLQLINLTNEVIDSDTITLYSQLPLRPAHWRHLALQLAGAERSLDRSRTFSEPAPQTIKAEYRFRGGLLPGHAADLSFRARIPHRTPLEGRRSWSAMIYRFTAELEIDIALPGRYVVADAEAIEAIDSIRRSVRYALPMRGSSLVFNHQCPTVGSSISIEFIARRA